MKNVAVAEVQAKSSYTSTSKLRLRVQLRWQLRQSAHRFYQGAYSKCFRLGRPRLHHSRLCPHVPKLLQSTHKHMRRAGPLARFPALGPGRSRKAGQMPHLTAIRPLLPTTHNGSCSSDWFPSISRQLGTCQAGKTLSSSHVGKPRAADANRVPSHT